MIRTTLEKHLNLLDYTLTSLWRRRLKNFSIMLVFAAVIFLLSSFQMVTGALTAKSERLLRSAPEITIQRMSAGRQEAIPVAYIEKIGTIFGIRRIVPRIWGYYFDEVLGANYTITGLEATAMPGGDKLAAGLASGELPGPGDLQAAVVGQSIKELLNLTPGSYFSLFRPDLSLKSFRVSGEFQPDTDILTNDTVLMGLEAARDLFAVAPDRVTDLCVSVANPAEIATIARRIAEILPDTRVLTRPQIQKTYRVVFGWRSGIASVCLLTALTAFVILSWDKASGLSPEEKREIGILKLLGWETSDILTVRFWEAAIVSGIAFLIGSSLAYVHVVFFDASLFRPVLMGWSVIVPDLRLVPELAAGDFLLVFSFSVLPYLAATVIPAWKNASGRADALLGGGE